MGIQMSNITEKKVFAAADALELEGKRVTVMNVRTKLGGGSYSTITPLVKQWREERAEKEVLSASLPDELEDAVDDFARRLWLEASKIADARVVAAEKAARECEEALEQNTAALEVEILRMEKEVGAAAGKLNKLNAEIAAERSKAAAADIRAAEAVAVKEEKVVELSRAMDKIDQIQKENGALSAEAKRLGEELRKR